MTGGPYIEYGHSWALVVLSYVLAALASFAALDMAERFEKSAGKAKRFWLVAAAASLGGGIWSMHFIAMLAFQVGLPVTFDVGATVLSEIVATVFTGIGFFIVGRNHNSTRHLIAAGVIVGIGVTAMHYSGMAAMRMPAHVHYDPLIVFASLVIAVVAATTALWLAFNWITTWQKSLAALVMAAAICGMHYTGMSGMLIEPEAAMVSDPGSVDRPVLAVAVTAATIGLLCIGLVSVLADRRFEARTASDAQKLRVANAELQAEVAERKAAEERLRLAQAALEHRVRERTKELAEANQRLIVAASELESARSRAESEKERAESANQAKTDFLASVSHELRTPLNAVLGFAQLLEINAKEPLTERQARQVGQITKSGNHLLALIEEVLDLSKIEAGTLRISLERVPLAPVFEQVRATLAPMAESMEVAFQVEIGDDIPPVRADRIRIAQVLINLGTNAIKYNRPGGTATLRAELIEPRAVRLSMADTGIGIAQHLQAEMFQPFNRLGAENGVIEGSGIGLTIAQRLIHLMDGKLSVHSVQGQGSIFTVEIPVAPAMERPGAQEAGFVEEAGKPTPAWQHQDGQYTLLYVEDNPSNITLMQELIDTLPSMKLLTAADGGTGIALAKAHRPDVIVLDINLPGMNGFEILRELKRVPATAGIPVIALSAAAAPRDIQRGKAEGFLHYLTKPINVAEFMSAIDGLLGERRENA